MNVARSFRRGSPVEKLVSGDRKGRTSGTRCCRRPLRSRQRPARRKTLNSLAVIEETPLNPGYDAVIVSPAESAVTKCDGRPSPAGPPLIRSRPRGTRCPRVGSRPAGERREANPMMMLSCEPRPWPPP